MALSSEHIPFTRSLSERVRELYEPMELEPEAPLERAELIACLAKSKDSDESPLAIIERRATKKDREPVLSHADSAVLSWVGNAFEEWEEQFPVEAPIRAQLHRLLPLAAAMALRDESFLTPGVHPLHQLLDALQNGAVGWQVRLDRAGQMLEQRVERSVEKALEWFNDETLDLTLITRELMAANDRDGARAQRMVQRLAETEEARLRTLSAKHDAAVFINEALAEYEIPAAIGEFLKGPWYDSAQLVLVKHGPESEQWSQMQRATRHLVQSVQDPSSQDDSQRDRREQMLRHLPGELRRWLLSLEHDSDATDSAIGLVEYAHLRLQHGQQLQRDRIEPLAVEEAHQTDVTEGTDESRTGDWYRFEDDEGELRAQLALQLEGGQHLIFTNFAGLKAIDLPRTTFLQRREDGFARHLPNVATFSISLARAVRIRSDRDYHLFLDPTAVPTEPLEAPANTEPEREISAEAIPDNAAGAMDQAEGKVETFDSYLESSAEPGTEVAAEDLSGRESPESEAASLALSLESETQDAAGVNAATAAPADELHPDAEPPVEKWALEPETANTEAATRESVDLDPVLDPPPDAETELTLEPITSEQETDEATHRHQEPVRTRQQPARGGTGPAPTQPQTGQVPPAYAPNHGQDYPPNHPPDYPPNQAPDQPPNYQPTPGAPGGYPPHAQPPVPQVPPGYEQFNPNYPAPAPATQREVDVPMGAWLGFHDGEAPIMAKLAVYDPRRDNYIFVNRKGIALRELNRAQLLALMDRGLVDILETRSYFREEVERAREEQP